MEAHKIFFVMFLVFGLIGAIRTSDPLNTDDLFFMHVNVKNEGTRDLDDLKVRVLFYDLGIVLHTNPFDLDDGNTAGKLVFWDVPENVPGGDYFVRIVVSNDDIQEIKHRIVTIA